MPPRKPHRDSVPQPAKADSGELKANGKEFNRVRADFLRVDVQTALTFTNIALQTDNSVKKRRNQRSARKAYDTVLRLAKGVDLNKRDARELSNNLERLKVELQTLGEVF